MIEKLLIFYKFEACFLFFLFLPETCTYYIRRKRLRQSLCNTRFPCQAIFVSEGCTVAHHGHELPVLIGTCHSEKYSGARSLLAVLKTLSQAFYQNFKFPSWEWTFLNLSTQRGSVCDARSDGTGRHHEARCELATHDSKVHHCLQCQALQLELQTEASRPPAVSTGHISK